MSSHLAIWIIAALAVAGVLIRPFATIEAVWAVGGAALLVVLRLITPSTALAGIAKGTDVYLFLTGMMLLAEVARSEGLFDWLAALATQHAGGSPRRLFLLIYSSVPRSRCFCRMMRPPSCSTPAVAAAVRTAKAEQPLPYLLICAFVANAASFVLPISNPANLVIYGSHMPPLLQWLPRYLLPSAVSIVATYVLLRWTQRSALRQSIAAGVPLPKLSTGGKIGAAGIVATAIVLLGASAMDMQLGLPTCIAGLATAAVVLLFQPAKTWRVVKDISWGVLPLVAGLFVLVEALNETGLVASISALLRETAAHSVAGAAWAAGIAVAFGSNLANNLPVGLIGGSVLQNDHIADKITRAILIGVDLGPNLSVTGSLATILWLGALRRERVNVGAGSFLKWGAIVMPPALVFAIAAALL